jgi:integrase
MPLITLSAQVCQAAACKEGSAKTDYYDTAITGFILTVSASGSKVFSLRYRDQYGKQRQHKIGDAKSITFDKARLQAQKLRSKVVLGENPAEDRQALRKVPTLGEFVADVYLPHVRQHRRNFQSTISFLNHHILPRFGSKHLDAITSEMISEAHIELRNKGYALAMANKLPILFKIMYNIGRKKKIQGTSINPANDVVMFVANNAKERFLSVDETQRLQVALEQSDNTQLKYIVPLMLMFGCRKRELLDAKWVDFDLERRNWHIPMSKNGKARNIPISSKALELLQKLPTWEGCPFVVPNPETKKPFGNLYCSWNTARIRAGLSEVRMHDLRHSFASNLVNSGQSIYVVSKLLGHSQIKTTARYSHLSDATLMSAVDAAAMAINKNCTPFQQKAA